MARAKTGRGNTDDVGDSENPSPNRPAPPAGMKRRTADQASGWVLKKPGVVVYGLIVGRFARVDKPEQHYYQIRLYQECPAVMNQEEITLGKGDIINVDENAQLAVLKEGMDEGDTVAWVNYIGQKRQKRDPSKTFWEIEVSTGSEEIPF